MSHAIMKKLNLSPLLPNIVISEDDGLDLLDNLLAADSPVTKVQCAEDDDDLDLDELLRKKDYDEPTDQALSPHTKLSTTDASSDGQSSGICSPFGTQTKETKIPGIRSPANVVDPSTRGDDMADEQLFFETQHGLRGPASPLRALSGRNISNEPDTNIVAAAAVVSPELPPPSAAAAAEKGSGLVSPPSKSSPTAADKQAILSSLTPRSPILAREEEEDVKQAAPTSPTTTICPILAREEDEDEELAHWINPPPAQAGDFLNTSIRRVNTSIRRVPSKSILKKMSSYGDSDVSMSSHNAGKSSRRSKGVSMDSDASMRMGKKKSSFLNLSVGSVNSHHSVNSGSSSYGVGVGLDLGDSSSTMHSPRSLANVSESKNTPIPILITDPDDADRAAGSTSNFLDLSRSSGKKMNRSVSFVSVDVREYDRTVGDNPSCRLGPPLSLDWSYSKKYEQPKPFDEYELEREPQRVKHLSRLYVNKFNRKKVLSFNWGHSEEEMKSARQETKKLQRQRSLTQVLLPIHMVEEAFIGVKGFIAKKRGKAECPKQELQRVTSELSLSISKSTKDISHNGRLSSSRTAGLPGSPAS